MRCKSCNYSLWNLPGRSCPECGAAFKPSDFMFVANAVRYECPHCAQAYYGTDANGHLVPQAFDCGKCGQHIDMDEMILRPAEGVKEESTEQRVLPWIFRQERSFLSAWFASVGMSLTKPGEMMRSLPPYSVVGKACSFLIFNAVVVMVGAIAPFLLIMIPMLFIGARAGGGGPGPGAMAGMGMGFGVMILIGIVSTIILVPLWAAMAHGLLLITGKCEGGWGRTFESLCFASGANVLSAIPCIGGYVGPIWWIVSGVITTKERQRVSGGRATLAVVLPPVVMMAAIFTAYGFFIAWAIKQGNTAATMSAASGTAWSATNGLRVGAQLTEMGTEIRQYAAMHQGVLPEHPLEYMNRQGMNSTSMIAPSSLTSQLSWTIGGVPLSDYEFGDAAMKARVVKRASADVAADPSAIRVADMIFTSQGVTLASADPTLWLVVCYPEPGANGTPVAGDPVYVVLANGAVTSFPSETLPSQMVLQNAVRAKMGLGPLPDLSTVK